jgi:glycosyltransferase involved in cell wall biosynthesis
MPAPLRLAIVVSHPIQYFAPLYASLARRGDIAIRVFFTWHAGDRPVRDRGFSRDIAWDIALTAGYESELVPNAAPDPGTHHFLGLRNPALHRRIMAWQPGIVMIHGWAWLSHLQELHRLHNQGIPTLFRGDSHLLDRPPSGLRWRLKGMALRKIFAWPRGFLVTGTANRAYYQAFGVPAERLFPCPHSIDVARFAEPSETHEADAARWRQAIGISPNQTVVLFAGKFEPRKRPVELARAVLGLAPRPVVGLFVGGGELQGQLDAIAAANPDRIRVLPFQNQSRMPAAYRLGDVFALPSAYGESWGLAVNEALACGRPVVVSDRVGCAVDVVDQSCGRIFSWRDRGALGRILEEVTRDPVALSAMREPAALRGTRFDVPASEAGILEAAEAVRRC